MRQAIKQIERSIDDAEQVLSQEEFEDYCDHAYSLIAILKAQ